MSSQDVVTFVRERLQAGVEKLSPICEEVGILRKPGWQALHQAWTNPNCLTDVSRQIKPLEEAVWQRVTLSILKGLLWNQSYSVWCGMFAFQMFDFCMAPDTMGDGTGCDNMTCIIVTFNQKQQQQQPPENEAAAAVAALERGEKRSVDASGDATCPDTKRQKSDDVWWCPTSRLFYKHKFWELKVHI